MLGGKAGFARTVQDLVRTMMEAAGDAGHGPPGLAAHLAFGLAGMTDSVVNGWLAADPARRGSAARLGRFLTEAACGQISAAAQVASLDIDLDRRL